MHAADFSERLELPQAEFEVALPFGRWPRVLRAIYDSELAIRRPREIRFFNTIGLVVTVCCLGLDFLNGFFEKGLFWRGAISVPVLLAAIALAGRSRGMIGALLLSVPVIVGAGVASHIGLTSPPLYTDRYLMAAIMYVGIGVLTLPIRTRDHLVMGTGGVIIIAGLVISSKGLATPGVSDMVLFVVVGCFAPQLIAHRTNRLKDRNFLYALQARQAQEKLSAANVELRNLSDRDSLTGIHNRRGFDRMFDEAFSASVQSDAAIAVLMIDIDHFKTFNDTHGHPAGDQAIRAVADAISGQIPAHHGTIARYGGEEFIAALHGLPGDRVMALSEQVRRKIAGVSIPIAAGLSSNVTASIGVAISRATATDRLALIGQADRALYSAKQGGRDRVALYLPSSEHAAAAQHVASFPLPGEVMATERGERMAARLSGGARL